MIEGKLNSNDMNHSIKLNNEDKGKRKMSSDIIIPEKVKSIILESFTEKLKSISVKNGVELNFQKESDFKFKNSDGNPGAIVNVRGYPFQISQALFELFEIMNVVESNIIQNT